MVANPCATLSTSRLSLFYLLASKYISALPIWIRRVYPKISILSKNTWERWALLHFTCKHENCSSIKSQLCNLYTFSAYEKAATSKISHYFTRHRCLIIRRCEPTATYQQRRRCRACDRQIWCVVHTRLAADI